MSPKLWDLSEPTTSQSRYLVALNASKAVQIVQRLGQQEFLDAFGPKTRIEIPRQEMGTF
jgi:hypothetical protein